MMRRALPGGILVLGLILMSCASARYSPRRQIESIDLIQFITNVDQIDKAVADPVSGTVFALSKANQQIHIYRDGKRINSIGGMGSQSYNFQRLSDICMDNDGSLLALDTVAKQLRRFSGEGLLLGRMDLSGLIQPELAVMSPDRDLIIYDAAPQELVCLSMFDGSELYRFGKFSLAELKSLSCSRDLLGAYSLSRFQTQVYYLLGELKDTAGGQYLIDSFGNYILIGSAAGDILPGAFWLMGIGESGIAAIYRDAVCLVSPSGIGIYKIRYGSGER